MALLKMQGGMGLEMRKTKSLSLEKRLFGDDDVHAVLVGDAAAAAIEDSFFDAADAPAGIVHGEFTGTPRIGGGFFVRRRGDEGLMDEYIQRVNAAVGSVPDSWT